MTPKHISRTRQDQSLPASAWARVFRGLWLALCLLAVLVMHTSSALGQPATADDGSAGEGRASHDERTPTDLARSDNPEVSRGPVAPEAATDPVAECLSVHEAAQVARLEGDLLGAEKDLARCSAPDCPAELRQDCSTWREEARADIPTMLVIARGDDGDIVDAVVFIDGVRAKSRLDGRPFAANPGDRLVRVVLASGESQERRVVLATGDKNRRIEFDFRSPEPAPDPSKVPGAADNVVYSRPTPAAIYVLGGVSTVSAAVALGFGIDAYAKSRKARRECAPICDESVSQIVAGRAAVADIAWGAAASAAIMATVLYVFRPRVATEAAWHSHSTSSQGGRAEVSLAPSDRGGALIIEGAF